MAWTGDKVSDFLTSLMNERLAQKDIIAKTVDRNPMYERISKLTESCDFSDDGKAKIVMEILFDRNAGPRPEAVDVMSPGADSYTTQYLDMFQYMSSIGFTQEEAEDIVTANSAAVANLVNRKINNAVIDMRHKLNYAYCTDGTGRLARVSAYDAGAKKVTVDNAKADFGWDKCLFLKDGMHVDIYTAPDITGSSAWTLKCSNVQISSVNRTAGTFVVTGATSSPADGDFVFLPGSVEFTSSLHWAGWTNTPGLLTIVDDGSSAGHEFNDGSSNAYNGNWYGTTWQHVTRTSYSQLLAKVYRADDWAGGTAGTPATCTLGDINACLRSVDEEGEGGGTISAIYMNPATRDWFAPIAAAAQNLTVTTSTNKVTGGVVQIDAYRTSTGRLIPIIPMVTLPDGTIIGGDENDLSLYEKVPLGWYKGNGGMTFPSPGTRNLTFEGWQRTRLVLAAKRCDNWFRMEDIDITA